MARLGAAVNIIATDGPAGRHGMTASAICSVSDAPASLLACINRSARMHHVLSENRRLSVNVLSGEQSRLATIFADKNVTMGERFAACDWSDLELGVPALDSALVTFACSIRSTQDMGSHSVFLCSVEQVVLGDANAGLIYFERNFHQLPKPSGPGCPAGQSSSSASPLGARAQEDQPCPR